MFGHIVVVWVVCLVRIIIVVADAASDIDTVIALFGVGVVVA